MANQKAISARINNNLLDKLEAYCEASGLKKNSVINIALAEYLEAKL